MPSTPLHHKPIFYGSPLADGIFLALVFLHFLPATFAPISAIVCFATRKGGSRHVRAGKVFVWSMAAVAVTGIGVDVVRLFSHYRDNHTKFEGVAMPSTIPARLGFLFAGICVLWFLRISTPPRVFERPLHGVRAFVVPGLLLALGALLTAVVFARFNPWTGALWMVWTFSALVVVAARARSAAHGRAAGAAVHGFGMSVLAGFAWWGALQGFGPAIAIAIRGIDPGVVPYVGDRPGPFTPFFFLFLVGWSVPFAIAMLLARRFRLQRR